MKRVNRGEIIYLLYADANGAQLLFIPDNVCMNFKGDIK